MDYVLWNAITVPALVKSFAIAQKEWERVGQELLAQNAEEQGLYNATPVEVRVLFLFERKI
ncbi:MAG: hypothetical protein IJ274_03620 [Lachnospiraceae bacterium]|nr:hypothetical protein [Lachnospiraceae bacterium]